MKNYDLLIKNGTVLVPTDPSQPLASVTETKTNVAINKGQIVEVGPLEGALSDHTIDAQGLHILPGLIDTQVHFREPGLEHKEDLKTGTQGAALGGITAVFEMPNTHPSTTTSKDLDSKLKLANNRCFTDFAFYIGASPENVNELKELESLPGCSGVKVFMGSSTGDLLIKESGLLEEVVKNGSRRMAVHCEDENRLIERKSIVEKNPGDVSLHPVWRDEITALNATQSIVDLAKKHNRPVHVLHITTKQEMDYLKENKDFVSVECTPQHLTLSSPECYEKLGTLAQMNPPIRGIDHQNRLWQGVKEGTVDIIGSDHAPHTLKEKLESTYPKTPSGMTGVQTSVPLMLDHIHHKRLTLTKLVELMCLNPCKLFKIKNKGAVAKGFEGTLTLVDLNKSKTITNKSTASRSGWTPFDGKNVVGWPTHTIIRGTVVMQNDDLNETPQGQPIEFNLS